MHEKGLQGTIAAVLAAHRYEGKDGGSDCGGVCDCPDLCSCGAEIPRWTDHCAMVIVEAIEGLNV